MRAPRGITLASRARDLRKLLGPLRRQGGKIGLVPTMGALHTGHLSLVAASRKAGCATVVSIFVNPTQFGPSEDFARYPRTLAADMALLASQGPLIVFAPSVAEMYPQGEATRVHVECPLTQVLEGSLRPVHFTGVATVVAKLLGLAGPCTAFFGEKDWQQLQVVRRMAQDLCLDARIVGCPIVREPDGLALSSRNAYLSAEERRQGPLLKQSLDQARKLIRSGESSARALGQVRRALEKGSDFKVDYLVAVDAASLQAPKPGKPRRLLVAARLGKTRLIDNIAC